MSRIVYLKKKKEKKTLFARLLALLAHSSCSSRFCTAPSLLFLLASQGHDCSDLILPSGHIVLALFLFNCFTSAACNTGRRADLSRLSCCSYWKSLWKKECLLNAQNVIPTPRLWLALPCLGSSLSLMSLVFYKPVFSTACFR